MSQKTITIAGPFTDDDVKFLLWAVRECERRQPTEKFMMKVEDTSDRPVSDIKDMLRAAFPAVDGVPVTIETYNKE